MSFASFVFINREESIMLNMLKFICYPKCTTCQKAKKWLDDNNIAETELRKHLCSLSRISVD